MIYQIKIKLEGIKPPVWRRVLVRTERTFEDLHYIIQAAMGWECSHLHEFKFKNVTISPMEEEEFYLFSGTVSKSDYDTKLFEMFESENKCVYTYDFGDGWKHTVQLEKRLEEKPAERYPVCTGGARACPPEDCGGPWGYLELLEALADKTHPQHEGKSSWMFCGDEGNRQWDAELFDKDVANERLEDLRGQIGEDGRETEEAEPTRGQWEKLYSLAMRIKEIKPWQTLFATDYIAVQPGGYDEPVYFSTMGRSGDCIAVAVLRGNRALARLEEIMDKPETEQFISLIGTQDCVVCYYGDREELNKEERALLRELGIKFRGRGEWIFFRSLKPGYLPWRINYDEAEFVCETLEQYMIAYEECKSGECGVDFKSGEFLLRRQNAAEHGAGWESVAEDLDEISYGIEKIEITNELYIARLRKKKRSAMAIELDMLYVPVPVQEDKQKRPFFPRLILAIDRRSGEVVEKEIMTPEEDGVEICLEVLHRLAVSSGRPRCIYARDKELIALLQDFCEKLDIELKIDAPMPAMDSAAQSLIEMLELDDFDEY